jgi:hypothetical protein
MSCSDFINSLGLILDLGGVVLIYLFGIAPKLDIEGQTHRITGEIDYEEISKAKKYKNLSHCGLLILFAGFLLQLISNFLKV